MAFLFLKKDIPELLEIATGKHFKENNADKHKRNTYAAKETGKKVWDFSRRKLQYRFMTKKIRSLLLSQVFVTVNRWQVLKIFIQVRWKRLC
jgi:hypothetical protein